MIFVLKRSALRCVRPRWERCFGPWALQITKTIITLHWRRFRYRSLMRFKGRNVLYVPGVITVHVSTYATSSVRQRHSRGTPPPRWCPPPETSCTSPSANPKTGQGTHLSRGSMSFTNALRPAAHCGPSDMECTLTFPYHQEFSKKSSGEQSYDLERDRRRSACSSEVVLCYPSLHCGFTVANNPFRGTSPPQ